MFWECLQPWFQALDGLPLLITCRICVWEDINCSFFTESVSVGRDNDCKICMCMCVCVCVCVSACLRCVYYCVCTSCMYAINDVKVLSS